MKMLHPPILCCLHFPRQLFLSCNHLFPAILKFVVATWLDTAEVLAELQLLLMQGDQLIGLVPLWRLMNYTVDLGTVTLCPCLIARIGERGRLNNDFRYHAWWSVKLVLDQAEILWNEMIIVVISISPEAAIQRCSYKKLFWKYATNLQENTNPEVRFQ